MLNLVIWRIGTLLEILILLRSFRSRLFARYPYFYAQFACAFATDILVYAMYGRSPDVANSVGYEKWYWVMDGVTNFVSCGCIIVEILKHMRSPYPDAKRLARILRLVVCGVILCFAVAFALITLGVLWVENPHANMKLQRDFLAVVAVILLSVIGAILYYGTPLGRNTKGLILGYGITVGWSMVSFAILSYGRFLTFDVWYYVPPLSWDVALAIWLITLWDYHPDPAPQADLQVVWDRASMDWRVTHMMGAVRAYLASLARVAQP